MFDHREMTKRKYHSIEFKFVAPLRTASAVLYFCIAWLYSLFSDGLVDINLYSLVFLGERICERYDIARAANQSAACRNVGDIAKLVVGNVQQLR